ncbi:MAG TPA: class I SAM-dependent methyltransferase [Thermoleophilia bacterium]|nr:class I SAM-dependent methyltransferase [Thermoleophilia bacterium]
MTVEFRMRTHRKRGESEYAGIPIHAAPGVHEAVLALVREYVRPGSRLVDLGAGSGALSLRLANCGYQVEAADLNVSDWGPVRIPVVQQDLSADVWASLAGRTYDTAVAVELIEHLENPTQFLRNARRLLRVGGYLLLTTPNVLDLDSRRLLLTKGEFALFRRGTLYSTGHLAILPYWLLEDLLQLVGFRVIERRFVGKRKRPGLRGLIVPLVNLVLLPLGLRLPWQTAFGTCVAILCTPLDDPAGSEALIR